jgi:hypothetical protein
MSAEKQNREPVTRKSGDSTESSKPEEEKLNQFGLPENWSRDASLKGLEYIRVWIEKNGIRKIPREVLEHVFSNSSTEYKKYTGREHVSTDGIRMDSMSDIEDLALTPEEKLKYFQKRWPKGLEIMGTDKHVKWEAVLEYELWAIGMHDQTFAKIQKRGGLGLGELGDVLNAVKLQQFGNLGDENIMTWLQENEMLSD